MIIAWHQRWMECVWIKVKKKSIRQLHSEVIKLKAREYVQWESNNHNFSVLRMEQRLKQVGKQSRRNQFRFTPQMLWNYGVSTLNL